MLDATTAPEKAVEKTGSSRRRLHEILDLAHVGDAASRIVDLILIALITGSVVAVILESIPSIEIAYADTFYWIEVVTVAIFTVEYFLRVWSAVEDDKYENSGKGSLEIRIRYIFSPYALIDFLAILPFYLLIGGFASHADMRILRCIRLLRILKLTRYSNAFDTLITTCKENTRPLIAAFIILITVLLLASAGMYFFERHAQPVAFGSIPDSMWWAVSTLTTVGYGDVTPFTAAGKIFGAVITIIGIGMVALPTGILASGYATQSALRTSEFRWDANQALRDGVITKQESDRLERLRLDLSIGESTAEQILDSERHRRSDSGDRGSDSCPHCGSALNPG